MNDGQGKAKRGQTAGCTRYARFFFIFIYFTNDYLTCSMAVPSPEHEKWARFSCPGSPPPPTSYVFVCFSPQKHKKHACLGVFLVISTLPLPSNTKNVPFQRVFGDQRPPSPPSTHILTQKTTIWPDPRDLYMARSDPEVVRCHWAVTSSCYARDTY
jgi:hypothetical protein